MAAIRELADYVFNVDAYGPTAIGARLEQPEFSMQSSRELTFDDLERMHPSLFREN